ncbi:MAG: tRNA preQ1(34) S-adenosylmethionine ribosyltransferase-isomerase QueA [Desulfitobacteriaceae bacterium]|nr:tRNA preQ1(34) S-adenosylmethionine ribosyltransferase-isomerase QueA [Desulfitobacteriaceae bacterium]
MKVAEFDYFLPEELIAQHPVEPRDSSRLMVLHKDSGTVEHKIFRDVVEYLNPGDVLVINNTKVLPARVFAVKESGGKIEVVLLKQLANDRWEVLVRPGKRVKTGTKLIFSLGELEAEVSDRTEAGGRILDFKYQGNFFQILDRVGHMPLPPYIREELADGSRYQTVYARERGSAAAPTAGLHFTRELLETIENKGIIIAQVLLHVGLGTFRPVKVENVEEHQIHSEYYQIDYANAEKINKAKKEGNRVVCVGTTSTRTLETVADERGFVSPGQGWSNCYIYPGYKYKAVDVLITNFHLPKSTLLMLVSAFAGHENAIQAYRLAVEERYRFFSFGDAMLII